MIINRYALLSKIGTGGFASTYRGFDHVLKREVAIKVLPKTEAAVHEAVVLSKLDHANIVLFYDIVIDTNQVYLIMELVPGGSVDSKPLTLQEIIDIGNQACDGLAFAHERGIVHCDLKPAHLLFSRNGSIKIADFGIASHNSHQSMRGGTRAYMAPEQIEDGIVDARTDVYSLGKVISELVRTNSIIPPESLTRVLHKATNAHPNHRYQSIEDMRGDLVNVEAEEISLTPRIPQGVTHAAIRFAFFSFVTYLLLQSELTVPQIYSSSFSALLGPAVVGFIALYSKRLAFLSLGIITLPAMFF